MGFLDWFKSNSAEARATAEAALAEKFRQLASAITTIKKRSAAKRIAMNLIVPQMAALTLGTYASKTGRREKLALHNKLNYALFGDLTGCEFWSAMFNNLLADNNAFARIGRIAAGADVSLLTPLKNTEVAAVQTLGGVQYVVKGKPIDSADIFHLRLNSYDGVFGVRFEDEVNCFSLANEAEAMAIRFYEQGGNIRRVWKLVDGGTPEQEVAAQTFINAAMKGTLKQHLDVVIPSHITKGDDVVGSSFKDGQMIESREFEHREILALYGVDPANIDLEKIYQISIVPILENVEQAITKRILSATDRLQYRVKYVEAGRFRGDTAKQYEIAVAALAVHSVNEIRGWFNCPPLGPEYDAIINPNTSSAKVNEQRQAAAKGKKGISDE